MSEEPFKFAALGVVKKISEKEQKALSEAAKIYTGYSTTSLIEKLEGMRKSYSMRSVSQEYNEGYNQALQDAIELIKEQTND